MGASGGQWGPVGASISYISADSLRVYLTFLLQTMQRAQSMWKQNVPSTAFSAAYTVFRQPTHLSPPPPHRGAGLLSERSVEIAPAAQTFVGREERAAPDERRIGSSPSHVSAISRVKESGEESRQAAVGDGGGRAVGNGKGRAGCVRGGCVRCESLCATAAPCAPPDPSAHLLSRSEARTPRSKRSIVARWALIYVLFS